MTTRTVSIDLIRRDASRHRRDQRDFCRTRSDVTHIDDGLLAGETAARVARALQSLAPEERDAIICAYDGGSSYCDVALDSGVAEGTIKSRIRRGLSQLRRSLPDLAPVATRAASGARGQRKSPTQT